MVRTIPILPRSRKRASIVHIAIRIAGIQQIIAIPLLVYEMGRGKEGLQIDAWGYLFCVISWPFSWWASRPATLGEHEPDWLPYGLWFLAPILWSALIFIFVRLWRRKHP